MPELPEVETVRRTLMSKVQGKTIRRAVVKKNSRLLRDTVSGKTLSRRLSSRSILSIGRRGKYLLFELSSEESLIIHLGMTGKLFLKPLEAPLLPHTHLRLLFDDCELALADPRTFGRVFLLPKAKLLESPPLARLGPEPLDGHFTAAYMKNALARRNAALKAVLLDQSFAAGTGNIYADEACHRAGVLPFRRASSLTEEEIKSLRKALRAVLRESIKHKGTTIRDYEWDLGNPGGFAARLRVYGRAEKPCPACGATIQKGSVAGRSTYYCPSCQR